MSLLLMQRRAQPGGACLSTATARGACGRRLLELPTRSARCSLVFTTKKKLGQPQAALFSTEKLEGRPHSVWLLRSWSILTNV